MIAIGIDTGTKTGLAVWDCNAKQFTQIATMKIHKAMETVLSLSKEQSVFVVVEDARQAVYGRRGAINASKAQGAGSVKRDASIWEDFLNDKGIPHRMARPNKATTKMQAGTFQRLTGWHGRTSEHARDAAMLVIGHK